MADNIKKIFIFPLSHADVGFNAPPSQLEEEQLGFLEEAIGIAESHPEFFWMIETGRFLERWIRSGRESKILLDLVKRGRMGVGANYTTPHTMTLGDEEIFRLFYPIRSLEKRYCFNTEIAILNDIPGFSWAIPEVLSKCGIKYLVAGTNISLGGELRIPKAHNPFYWQGVDGSRILVWISRDNYLEGYFTWKFHMASEMGKSIPAVLKALEDEGYTHDAVLTIFGTGDHSPPKPFIQVMANIAEWNLSGGEPEIIISNPIEFFRHIEEKYGDSIPTYSGECGGLWDVTKRYSPAAVALRNRTRDRMQAVEFFSSMNRIFKGIDYPHDEIREIFGNMLRLSDHGAGATVGWDDILTRRQVEDSNRESYNFARDADEASTRLISGAIESLLPLLNTRESSIVVLNPLPFERGGVVHVMLPDGTFSSNDLFELREEGSGKLLKASLSEQGFLEFVVDRLPAMGFKRYRLIHRRNENRHLPEIDSASELYIENEFYRVSADRESGRILSILDKESAREIIDRDSAAGLGFSELIALLNDKLLNSPTWLDGEHPVRAERAGADTAFKETASELRIEREGSPHISTVIRLFKEIKRIDIENTLDISKMPEVTREMHSLNYLFTFPFNMDASNMDMSFDTPAGFINPKSDYLPGAVVGPMITQHSMMLKERSSDGIAVILSNRESYINLWNGGSLKSTIFNPKDSTIFSLAMAKSEYGKTKDQGLVRFEKIEPVRDNLRVFGYSITTLPSVEATPSRAKAEGWGHNMPPIGRYIASENRGVIDLTEGSFIGINRSNIMITCFKRAEEWVARDNRDERNSTDLFIIRLREYDGLESDFKINTLFPVKEAWEANSLEEPIRALTLSKEGEISMRIKARESLTILIKV